MKKTPVNKKNIQVTTYWHYKSLISFKTATHVRFREPMYKRTTISVVFFVFNQTHYFTQMKVEKSDQRSCGTN